MSISRITASILRPLSKEIIQALGEIGVSLSFDTEDIDTLLDKNDIAGKTRRHGYREEQRQRQGQQQRQRQKHWRRRRQRGG